MTKVRQLSSAAASAGLKTSSCSGCPCRCPGCPLAERLSQEVKAGSWSPSSSSGPRERKNASYTALGEAPSLTEGRLGPPGEGDRPKVSITCSGRKRNLKNKQFVFILMFFSRNMIISYHILDVCPLKNYIIRKNTALIRADDMTKGNW